ETERMNSVTKTAKENYSEQIAKLTLLNKTVKEGGLSFNEKKKAVDDYNKTFGETLGTVKSYTELEKKLIENGPAYIKYLGLKAKAEAAYQLALEKSKESLIKRNSEETKFGDYLKAFTTQSYEGETSVNVIAKTRNNEEARNREQEAEELLNIQEELNEDMERLAKELGLIFDTPNNELAKEFNKMADLLQNLIKKQKSLRDDLIQNDRDREVSQITEQLEEEKK